MLSKIKSKFSELKLSDYINIVMQLVIMILAIRYFVSVYKPISEVAKYIHSGMDDYWMSVGVHWKWVSTHSLFACVKEAFNNAVFLYKTWDGNFLSMFLTNLSPVAARESLYYITYKVALYSMIIGILTIAYTLLHRRWKISIINCISISLLFLIFYIKYEREPSDGMFWWPGVANYNLYFGMILFAQGLFILYWEKKNIVWLVISSIVFFLIGLGNPITGLVNVCLLAYEVLYEIYRKRSFKHLFYIPFASALIGLMIVVTAPGNAYRTGQGTLSIFETIAACFKYGTEMKIACAPNALYLYLILVSVIALFDFMKNSMNKAEQNDRKNITVIIETIVFTLLMVCLYYASYAPIVYTKCDWYGRVLNTTGFVYLMTMTVSSLYICRTIAYFIKKYLCKVTLFKKINCSELFRYIAAIGAVVCIIIVPQKLKTIWDYMNSSLVFYAEWSLENDSAITYHKQRTEFSRQLEDPNITEVHVGDFEVTAFYPYISDLNAVADYYGKTIIYDGGQQ